MKVVVKLMYFKQTGKYYTDGEFEIEVGDCSKSSGDIGKDMPYIYDIIKEVRRMNEVGPMPGLTGNWDGPIYIDTEPSCYPSLILSDQNIDEFWIKPKNQNIGNQFQRIMDCLDTAYINDPDAMQALCSNRVPCNQHLADHPTIPVDKFSAHSGYIVGMLGILNGVLESAGLPLVSMKFSEEADDNGCHKFLGFREYTQNKEPWLGQTK